MHGEARESLAPLTHSLRLHRPDNLIIMSAIVYFSQLTDLYINMNSILLRINKQKILPATVTWLACVWLDMLSFSSGAQCVYELNVQ